MRAVPILLLMLSLSPPASAEHDDPDSLLPFVSVHGFVSPGYIFSTSNNYLAKSTDGSFEFTEVGINFTTSPIDRLRIGLQLFARDLGRRGDYSPKLDWFYLDYKVQDWLGLRAGRVKLPYGLYNEISDIDTARVPVLLPQSVYPIENRDFLLAQTGAELYGLIRMGKAGALDYRAYGGTIFIDTTSTAGSPTQVQDLTVPYVVGGRLMWETPLDGFRIGASVQAIRLDTTLLFTVPSKDGTPATPKSVTGSIDAVLWVVSAEFVADDLQLAVEFGRWHATTSSNDETLFPAATTVSERGYAMLSYRFFSWLQPGLYYSMLWPNIDKREGWANQQHDIALTWRADISDFWTVKLEGHFMHGTAVLERALNGGKSKAELERDWGVVLLKTSAYF